MDLPRDEPLKLAEIVVPLLGPVERQEVSLTDGSTARLLIGALAQDDCASYVLHGDMCLVAGSDYIRGAKFLLYEMGALSNYEIGWYLAGANWSDVAAMGAIPLGLLSVIRYPKGLPDSDFEDILRGIADSCASVHGLNIGGDIGGAERIILSATAFGIVEPSGMLTRSGASPGDVICLTGATGYAGSAMKLAAAGLPDRHSAYSVLLAKWQRIEPRVAHGRLFSTSGAVTACLDTSDGLKGALETLAERSQVGVEVFGDTLPVPEEVVEAARLLNANPLDLVFGDSVDFELLCAVKEDRVDWLVNQCNQQGLTLHIIGRTRAEPGVTISMRGRSAPVPGQAWRHQENPAGG
jgi:thiamine-monophosphate kinase